MSCHHPSLSNLLEKLRRRPERHEGIYLVECRECHEEVAVDFLRLALTDAEPSQDGKFTAR